MKISANFDGGNIDCLDCTDPADIRLEIRKDAGGAFHQWFYFRLTGARGQDCVLNITNAGAASYPAGWRDYRAVASYDRADWFRVETGYDDKTLSIRHRPGRDLVYYAYFAPYTMERHADLISRAAASPLVRLSVLGESLDGQDIDLLRIGEPGPDKRQIWAIARQHPGESMAEWWMEGLLDRLLDPDDPAAEALLKRAVFHIVPNMNPDGSRRGHLRTNAAGANLNREWAKPSLEQSPEVYLVRAKMQQTGVDFLLDVHGDEALPYNFLTGMVGIPSLSKQQRSLMDDFKAAMVRASPDFQTEHGYPTPKPGKANLTLCANYVAETFRCLALTLEQPFKDNADAPDERHGWSPERAKKLGAATLDALAAVLGDLR